MFLLNIIVHDDHVIIRELIVRKGGSSLDVGLAVLHLLFHIAIQDNRCLGEIYKQVFDHGTCLPGLEGKTEDRAT